MPIGMEVGLGPGDIVLDGDLAFPPRGTAPKFFGPCPLGPNGWVDQDATWYTEVNLGPCNVVLHGVPSPQPLKGAQHVYCGQTAGWMKTPLGTEVDLGPGHIVLDGTQLPRPTSNFVIHPQISIFPVFKIASLSPY